MDEISETVSLAPLELDESSAELSDGSATVSSTEVSSGTEVPNSLDPTELKALLVAPLDRKPHLWFGFSTELEGLYV